MDPDLVFEISWEVCNKVGGIFTVVSSKAAQMVGKYKEKYFLIGPYFENKALGIFEEKEPWDEFKEVFEILKQSGIHARFGTWLVKGEPNAILLDFKDFTKYTDGIKKDLWERYGIDSLNTNYYDFDEPIVWGYAVGKLLEELAHRHNKIVAHAHEWLSGSSLLYCDSKNLPVATVFTTHATALGRAMASSGMDLYNILDKLDPEEEARKKNVLPKFQVERACANKAKVFTTVSEITGIEAEKLLGKKPDVLLLNGLDLEKFPTFEEASIKHIKYRERIREFCMFYFFPYYTFDLSKTIFLFLAGRHEYRDKGIDIYIKALGELNKRMAEEKSEYNVVAFIWVPGDVKIARQEILENRTHFEDVKESLSDNWPQIKNSIIETFFSWKNICTEQIFSTDLQHELKRKAMKLKKSGDPPISTHELCNCHDEIQKGLAEAGLDNKGNPKVKVVYYPIYLTGADNLLNTNYYESMQGAHLGIFPSFYEPWGYTPLEAGALGVASVTSDLAGFGRYVKDKITNDVDPGIWVLNRMGVEDPTVVDQLSNAMHHFVTGGKNIRVKNKINARHLAMLADWKEFVNNYLDAHKLALESLEENQSN